MASASIGRCSLARTLRRPAKVRSLHQRRSRHDVAVPARRGLRHRRRRRDRPRSRALRALHRLQTSPASNVTAGDIYDTVIRRERRGDYLGGTVQVVPHITDEIKGRIAIGETGCRFVITEIGGTVGDIEVAFSRRSANSGRCRRRTSSRPSDAGALSATRAR